MILTDTTDMSGLGEVLGILAGIWFVALAISIFYIICNWKICVKAGEPGWAAIVPFYNSYVMYKIAWGNGWMFLCQLIPMIGFVFPLIMSVKLAGAFGKGFGYGLGLIFLPIIFQPMLAFGNAEYVGPQA